MPRCKKSWLFFLYLIDIFSHLCYTLNKCNLQHSQRGRHMKKHIPAATLAVGIIALCAVLGGCNGEGETSSVQMTTTSVTTSATAKSTTTSQTSPQTTSSASSITTVTTKETTTTSAVTTTKPTRAACDGRSYNRSASDRPTTDQAASDRPAADRAITAVYNHSDSRRGQGLQQRRCTY